MTTLPDTLIPHKVFIRPFWPLTPVDLKWHLTPIIQMVEICSSNQLYTRDITKQHHTPTAANSHRWQKLLGGSFQLNFVYSTVHAWREIYRNIRRNSCKIETPCPWKYRRRSNTANWVQYCGFSSLTKYQVQWLLHTVLCQWLIFLADYHYCKVEVFLLKATTVLYDRMSWLGNFTHCFSWVQRIH